LNAILPIDSDQKDIGTKFNRASFQTAYKQTLNTSGVTKDRSMAEEVLTVARVGPAKLEDLRPKLFRSETSAA